MRKKRDYTKLARFYSWEDYGIDRNRLNELKEYCKDKKYKEQVTMSAYLAEPYVAKWIIKSVCTGKTYEKVEYDRELGRIPCGRTDFYGYRRRFYDIFDLEMRKIENGTNEKNNNNTIKEGD